MLRRQHLKSRLKFHNLTILACEVALTGCGATSNLFLSESNGKSGSNKDQIRKSDMKRYNKIQVLIKIINQFNED